MSFLLNPYRFAAGGGGGSAEYVAIATAEAAAGATSITVNKPTGVQSGDILLFMYCANSTSTTETGPDSDSSWTKVWKRTISSFGVEGDPGTADTNQYGCWSKVAGGSEPSSYTLALTDGGLSLAAIVAFRGVSGLGTHAITHGNTANSVTGQDGGFLLSMFCTVGDNGTYDGPPTGMTEIADLRNSTNSALNMHISYQALTADGATGTRVVQQTGMNQFFANANIPINVT